MSEKLLGHPRSHHFEGLPTGHPLANFHNSAVNSVRAIANVKVCHGRMDRRTEWFLFTKSILNTKIYTRITKQGIICGWKHYNWLCMGLERSVLAIRFRSFVEFRISSRELMLLVAEFSAVDCLIIGQLNNKWSKDNGEEHWHVIFWMNFFLVSLVWF